MAISGWAALLVPCQVGWVWSRRGHAAAAINANQLLKACPSFINLSGRIDTYQMPTLDTVGEAYQNAERVSFALNAMQGTALSERVVGTCTKEWRYLY